MSKHKWIIVCSSPNGRGIHNFASYLTNIVRGRLVTCKSNTRWFVAWEMLGIVRYVRMIRMADETVFANTRVSPLLWTLIDWKKITVVVHDLMDTRAERLNDDWKNGIRKKVARRVNSWIIEVSVRKAGKVIFNSRYTETQVSRWLNGKMGRACVIYPPPSFAGIGSELTIEEGSEEVDKGKIKILVVTGMTKNKVYEEYRVFHERLQAEIGKIVSLVIYGVQLEKAEVDFQKWVVESNGIVSIKYKRDLRELLSDYLECNLVCSLSIEEGYGMPVADAVGFGIPVIARSIGAYREVKQKFDEFNMLRLGRDVDDCVAKAAKLLQEMPKKESKEERFTRYRRFCRESEIDTWEKLRRERGECR